MLWVLSWLASLLQTIWHGLRLVLFTVIVGRVSCTRDGADVGSIVKATIKQLSGGVGGGKKLFAVRTFQQIRIFYSNDVTDDESRSATRLTRAGKEPFQKGNACVGTRHKLLFGSQTLTTVLRPGDFWPLFHHAPSERRSLSLFVRRNHQRSNIFLSHLLGAYH